MGTNAPVFSVLCLQCLSLYLTHIKSSVNIQGEWEGVREGVREGERKKGRMEGGREEKEGEIERHHLRIY